MKHTVYRVQCKKGRGPYKPGTSHVWLEMEPDTRPTVMDEFGWEFAASAKYGRYVGCAFRNIPHLRGWFTDGELRKLGIPENEVDNSV
jgi:hypothetical protein